MFLFLFRRKGKQCCRVGKPQTLLFLPPVPIRLALLNKRTPATRFRKWGALLAPSHHPLLNPFVMLHQTISATLAPSTKQRFFLMDAEKRKKTKTNSVASAYSISIHFLSLHFHFAGVTFLPAHAIWWIVWQSFVFSSSAKWNALCFFRCLNTKCRYLELFAMEKR